jgi:hypothetical protein
MHGTKKIYQEGREAFRNSVGSLYMRADSVDAPSLWDVDSEDTTSIEQGDPRTPPAVDGNGNGKGRRGRSASIRHRAI